jgi:mannose-6-phosphate isomerase
MEVSRERAHRAWRQAERVKRLSDGLVRVGPWGLGVDALIDWLPGAGPVYSASAGALLLYEHLFETCLEWEAAGGDATWTAMADEIAELALGKFIDPATGVLQEYFHAQWRPLTGEAGLMEPGHHFEWAWLLERWGALRAEPRARAAARRLFEHGKRGVDPEREVAINALWDDLSIRDPGARLWPQTEYLKAALILGEDADALTACRGLARYLDVPTRGAWRDKMRPDGGFLDEHAPASSFYHIMVALQELFAATGQGGR